MYNYINNPITNQKYPINSVEGLNILKKYLTYSIGGKKSKCKKFKLRWNPKCKDQKGCQYLMGRGCVPIKKKKRKKKKHNKVLEDKLDKINNNNYPQINELRGLLNIYLWDIKCPNNSKKQILLIGDEHARVRDPCSKNKKGCLGVVEFIEEIIKTGLKENKCIDLFAELSQKKLSRPEYLRGGGAKVDKKNLYGWDILYHIKKYYKDCSWHAIKKAKCKHSNLRFHNFDLRFSYTNRKRATNKLDGLLFYMKKNTKYKHWKHYSLLADYILGYDISKSNQTKLNKILEFINKSIKTISTPSFTKKYTVTEIKKDMESFRKVVKKEYNKFLKYRNKYLPKSKMDLRKYIKKMVDIKYKESGSFFEYTHLFTDLYVLSRIFMEFSQNKNKKIRSPENCPIVINNKKTINISPSKVIIVAGADHIDLYNRVLNYYYPKSLVYKTRNSYLRNKIIKRADISPKINSFSEIISAFIDS